MSKDSCFPEYAAVLLLPAVTPKDARTTISRNVARHGVVSQIT
jgi:hypothetical protein